MSVQYFYLTKAVELDAFAERTEDEAARRSLKLTADTWRLLACMAEKYGFSDLPALRGRVELSGIK